MLVDFLKGFMEDRGWNEGSLSTKHIINIETFLKNCFTKAAMILSSESLTIWRLCTQNKAENGLCLTNLIPTKPKL